MSEKTVEFIIDMTSSIRFFLWSALAVTFWFFYNSLAPEPLRIDDPKAWLFLNLWFGLFGYFQQILLLHNQRRQDEAMGMILRKIVEKEDRSDSELAQIEDLLRLRKRRHSGKFPLTAGLGEGTTL